MNQTLQNKSKTYSKPQGINAVFDYRVYNFRDIGIWLMEHFGLQGDRWKCEFGIESFIVTVYDEKDYTWFRLHW